MSAKDRGIGDANPRAASRSLQRTSRLARGMTLSPRTRKRERERERESFRRSELPATSGSWPAYPTGFPRSEARFR